MASQAIFLDEWNEFLNKVFEIVEDGKVAKHKIGQMMFGLHDDDMNDLNALRTAVNLDDVPLRSQLSNPLKDCRQILLKQKNQETLLSNEDPSENSRLAVEKDTSQIRKVSYLHNDGTSCTIWESRDSTSAPLDCDTNVDKLIAPIRVKEVCDTNVDELIASVHDEFDDTLLSLQTEAIKHKDLWKTLHTKSGENSGETVLQQAACPPFALVLLAAASTDPNFVCVAEQDACCAMVNIIRYVVSPTLAHCLSQEILWWKWKSSRQTS